MDTESAIQIIKSPADIRVLYNGSPVWLQSVNGDIARVRFMDSDRDGEVPVSQLVRDSSKAH